jgi:hypothetical protein
VWILIILVLFFGALAVFLWIARKGRQLRRNQPLPPEASHAYLQSTEGLKSYVVTPFYFGKNRESNNVILPTAKADFEACIFYHKKRFAIQALPGAAIVFVNQEEIQAGYLRDGDILEIGSEKFIFRCY